MQKLLQGRRGRPGYAEADGALTKIGNDNRQGRDLFGLETLLSNPQSTNTSGAPTWCETDKITPHSTVVES